MTQIVYWSGAGGTTRRAVERYGAIPLEEYEDGPFVLAFPSYGAPRTGGYVPPAVAAFVRESGPLMVGIVGVGNTTFGPDFCRGADILACEYGVPVLTKIDVVPTTSQRELIRSTLMDNDQTTLRDMAVDVATSALEDVGMFEVIEMYDGVVSDDEAIEIASIVNNMEVRLPKED